MRWVVQVTPLYQDVALWRGLMLGEIDAGLLWLERKTLRVSPPTSNTCSVALSTRSSSDVP